MKYFLRAQRDALAQWPLLLLATLCSVGVAAVWGGNIGAFFPILEVTLAGEPLQSWVSHEIQESMEAITAAQSEIDELRERLPGMDQIEQRKAERQLGLLEDRIGSETSAQRRMRGLQPYVERYLPRSAQQTILLVVIVCLVTTIIKQVLLLANSYLIARVSATIARDIRRKVFAHALDMDRRGFSGYSTSGFTAHITHSTEMLSNGITAVFGGAIREPLKLLACLIGAGVICWRLLFISMVVVPLVVVLVVALGRKVKSVCRSLVKNATGLHHVMLEAFSNIQTVQAYGMEGAERKRFDAATDSMLRYTLKTTYYNSLSRPITELLCVGMMGTALIAGAYLVLEKETHFYGLRICDRPLSTSSLLVFFGMLVGATDPVRKMASVIEGINTGMVAADMIYKVLDRKTAISDPQDPISVARPHRRLQINHVSFAYQREDYVLQDATLDIPHGSKIALIGANGSGKSSLVNLLCRFYDIQSGCIRMDGVDIRKMRLDDLRSRIGLVTQQSELFNESIMYNIKYGSQHQSDAAAMEAAKMAYAHQFIEQCPEGYDTKVGQGGQRLSGGQRQRIALARAFLRDPEILILDEATSQIDVVSEQLIHDAIRVFGQTRTVIMITHRVSTLELADVIYEFRDGKVEKSAHPMLRAAS